MKLESAEVFGMLGKYHHRVAFSDNEAPYRIIYGPNGVGKTKFLELIAAALSLDPYAVAALPFRDATFSFVDGSILRVTKSNDADDRASFDLEFVLERPGNRKPSVWTHSNLDQTGHSEFERMLERETLWREVQPGLWQDQSDDEVLEIRELRRRYPSRYKQFAAEPPEEFKALIVNRATHLIETQRLHNYREDSARPPSMRREPRSSTVSNFTKALQRELQRVQAQNSRASQQLERTFPRRVLEKSAQVPADVNQIRERYDAQSEFRKRLGSIGLIANEIDFPLPSRELEDWETSVLWIYLTDTDEKLKTFERILQKIETFTAVINKRFLDKRIRVSAEEGLIIESADDGGRLPADSLSSGEQHELILMYDLTFNVQRGSLVMIDEPEISLHVSWQLEFIRDVTEIAELSDFQFLVATHSPQIIADNWALSVKFGPEGVAFE